MGICHCCGTDPESTDDLSSIEDRVEILERLFLSEVPAERRATVERELREHKRRGAETVQLEADRKWLREVLQRIEGARETLKACIGGAVWRNENDGRLYVNRDGRTYRPSAPYGLLKLFHEARAAGLESETDLLDTELLERRLEDWNALFDTDEIVKLTTKVDDLSQAELDELAEDLQERLKRFHKGYAGKDEASDNEEG